MTGVGGRPEVIVEGSNSTDGGWMEYQFKYKPGDVYRRPPVVGNAITVLLNVIGVVHLFLLLL